MNLQQAVSRLIAALNEAGLDYMLVGSFSSMYYSFPRSTTDADFVIGTADLDVFSLAKSLGGEFKFDPQLSFESFGGSIKNEIHIEGTPFRIELFRLTDQPFDRARFDRRRKVTLAGDEVWLPTAEDVILQKLIWSRRKDNDDVLGIIVANHKTLDRKHLDEWAETLGVTDELEKLWALALESTE
ncbi:hypothetical protein LF1_32490 [Rubripirellula obstinata]|uniref:DUF6036 domain-containing protein n=1 Tax=Rubripirellula obstinata TaxID=406547 RepID=A0A5B1CHP6_9BACT|nr:DUF6036 family nucleotidyltransferase [Rubripirellula obstinata]KAA1260708.1 hypothetical protein LF1_32490 [Rubripirellula obstinata]